MTPARIGSRAVIRGTPLHGGATLRPLGPAWGGEPDVADSFVHLHQHTEYSMLDGAARIGDVVTSAVKDGQPAMGITDHGNMYGVLDFYKECRNQGVKPIIGSELYMAHERRDERLQLRGARMDDSGGEAEGGKKPYYHLTTLVENATGYKNLIQLSSRAFMEGYYRKPKVDWEILAEHSEGLIVTTGCLGGHVLQAMMNSGLRGRVRAAGRLLDIFGRDHLFVELQDHGIPEQHRTNPELVRLAKRLQLPLLATNDSHYVHQHDAVAHDALLCVQTGSLMSDPDRFKFHGDHHYLKTAQEMRHLFREVRVRVRQLAVDRRAMRPRDRVRQAAAAQLPAARGLRRRRRLPASTSPSRAPRARWGRTCPTRSSSAWPTSSRSSATWGSRRTS